MIKLGFEPGKRDRNVHLQSIQHLQHSKAYNGGNFNLKKSSFFFNFRNCSGYIDWTGIHLRNVFIKNQCDEKIFKKMSKKNHIFLYLHFELKVFGGQNHETNVLQMLLVGQWENNRLFWKATNVFFHTLLEISISYKNTEFIFLWTFSSGIVSSYRGTILKLLNMFSACF